jgi:Tol biopolymer transport system component/DNA-binding winged helix-turn-helix (wHTH) protein
MPVYEFGPFRLDPAERLLLRAQQPVPLKPKAFDLLVLLVERPGRLLTKQELMDALWPATAVEEGNLTHTISTLRKALGDGQNGDQFIETVPTRGYRFVSPVLRQAGAAPAMPIDPRIARPVRGTRISRRLIAFALLLIIAVAATWWRVGRWKDEIVSSDHILKRLTADAGLTAYPAISPDGKLVVYASDRGAGNLDLWVQQIGGSDARPLTQDPSDDYEPTFSPDGGRVAFRSNRGVGGIYMVSALGGEARLIAPEGRRPRFSPDGQWLAYWVGLEHLMGDTYIVRVAGGQPRILQFDPKIRTRSPVWSPDGQRLLVSTGDDWWIAPLDGGPPIKTGAANILRSAIALQWPDDVGTGLAPAPEQWRGDGGGEVIFSTTSGDSRNLWRIALNRETGRAVGQPARFTFGTEWELQASSSATGRMTFASLSQSSNLWSLPVETNTARVTGDLHRITHESRQLTRPNVSLDGRILVYQEENRKIVLRLRNLEDGTETNSLDSDQSRVEPALTADGSRVLYMMEGESLYTIAASGGVPTRICKACDRIDTFFAYSPAGDRVAYTTRDSVMPFDYTTRDSVMQLDVSTGNTKRISSRGRSIPGLGGLGVKEMRYSPDGRWLAFHGLHASRRVIFLMDASPADGKDAEWIPATTEPAMSDARVAWSPDGNLLYFVSDRDGFLCIWAQRLESKTKRPVDRPFAVYHLHHTSPRIHHNVGRVGLAVARDKIVLALEELRGNVWMLEPRAAAKRSTARE